MFGGEWLWSLIPVLVSGWYDWLILVIGGFAMDAAGV
jgi:hypothetical protein